MVVNIGNRTYEDVNPDTSLIEGSGNLWFFMQFKPEKLFMVVFTEGQLQELEYGYSEVPEYNKEHTISNRLPDHLKEQDSIKLVVCRNMDEDKSWTLGVM